MTQSPAWDRVTHADVVRAIEEYDRLGANQFFAAHGFAPTTTYELVWDSASIRPRRSSAPHTSSPPDNAFNRVTSRAESRAP